MASRCRYKSFVGMERWVGFFAVIADSIIKHQPDAA
jgi:hypothetical protein